MGYGARCLEQLAAYYSGSIPSLSEDEDEEQEEDMAADDVSVCKVGTIVLADRKSRTNRRVGVFCFPIYPIFFYQVARI